LTGVRMPPPPILPPRPSTAHRSSSVLTGITTEADWEDDSSMVEEEHYRWGMEEEARIQALTEQVRVETPAEIPVHERGPRKLPRQWTSREYRRLLELLDHVDGPHIHPSRKGSQLKDKKRGHKIKLRKYVVPCLSDLIRLGEREMRLVAKRRRLDRIYEARSSATGEGPDPPTCGAWSPTAIRSTLSTGEDGAKLTAVQGLSI
ncbi:hypothetical protein BBP40_012068, partial [Aspergillus hancockii]